METSTSSRNGVPTSFSHSPSGETAAALSIRFVASRSPLGIRCPIEPLNAKAPHSTLQNCCAGSSTRRHRSAVCPSPQQPLLHSRPIASRRADAGTASRASNLTTAGDVVQSGLLESAFDCRSIARKRQGSRSPSHREADRGVPINVSKMSFGLPGSPTAAPRTERGRSVCRQEPTAPSDCSVGLAREPS